MTESLPTPKPASRRGPPRAAAVRAVTTVPPELVDTLTALHAIEVARKAARAERDARETYELAVRELADLGLSSRAIAGAIGHDAAGVLYVSPTLVQRLVKGEHAKEPRRRKR